MMQVVLCKAQLPPLKVSENKRFLVTADGKPFFWMGDTGWELFHRLNKADAGSYFKKRSEQGFNVIQAVVLAELDGLHSPNANGDSPYFTMIRFNPMPHILIISIRSSTLLRKIIYISPFFRRGEIKSIKINGVKARRFLMNQMHMHMGNGLEHDIKIIQILSG